MDRIIKAITLDKQVRIYIADTKEMVAIAQEKHKTKKTATAALGRCLTANAILAADLKNETDSISIQIRTEGPIGNIITYSPANCKVKGYATNPDIDISLKPNGKLDVAGALTLDGTLSIIKDIGLKEPYSGTIPLVSGEIAEDLTYYFAKSEQIPTSIALGVLVEKDNGIVLAAGGFMIQLLPDASEETISKIEEIVLSDISISKLLANQKTCEEILEILLNGLPYEILDEIKPEFKCDCSRYRFEKGIMSIGTEELDELISENENIETTCHFCNKKYDFTVNELKILRELVRKK